ncbi:uncharacterized protein VTP21DRAFT_5246 [Calcarisporiella thermophila]|uniref:uncharacterized protein n=1 Tax=Calcarisporiella thermophila TaxID=911321 RepID=UPI003742F7B0
MASQLTPFDDLEEDENEDLVPLWEKKDSILFVIDCSPSMLTKHSDSEPEIPFYTALKSAISVMKNKVIGSEGDYVGVLLYGTEKSKNSSNFRHIHVLQELDIPGVHRINELSNIEYDRTKFEEYFGSSSEELAMSEVLWTCIDMFTQCKRKNGTRRIFLITNEDDPHSMSPHLRNAAKTRARDLIELGIYIELFGIDKADKKFNYDAFYKEILEQMEPNGEDPIQRQALDTSGNLEELPSRVRRRETQKRALLRMPWEIAPDLTIGVRLYNLLHEQKKGRYKLISNLDGEAKEVCAVTNWICADTGEKVLPNDIKFYYPFGIEKVVFSKEELEKIKTFSEPGLKLLGFKSLDLLTFDMNVAHPSFIYPDDSEYSGSTRAFSAFWQVMLKMQRFALCVFVRRKCVAPRLVALIPQAEILNDKGVQERPPGFNMIFLPYLDDIRPIPANELPIANDEMTDVAKQIVNRLVIRGGYKPEAYENPSLQQHYLTLQNIALSLEKEDVEDKTLPKAESIHKRAGQDILRLKELVGEQANIQKVEDEEIFRGKRKMEDDSRSTKKARVQNGELDMRTLYEENMLDSLTIPQIKQWLESVGLQPKPKAKKMMLIEQVAQFFKSR